MKRVLFLLFIICIAGAQNNDTSREEALLDELLNTAPVETQSPAADETEPAQQSVTEPVSNDQPVESNSLPVQEEQPAIATEPVPAEPAPEITPSENLPAEETVAPSRRALPDEAPASRSASASYNGSPDLNDEARVQETPDIPNFSHKSHIEDVGAECVQCHQTLFSESVRGIKTGPSMKEICSQCHNGTDAPSELLAGFTDEKKYVKTHMPLFSHTKHMQHTEKCITCHNDIYGDLKKIKIPTPMDRCTGCHNDHKASSKCAVCHENPNKLKPKSHTSRWVYRNGHGKNARFKQNECYGCHTEQQCNTCHRGQSSFEVHRPGYKYSHGMDARMRTTNCGYCHDAAFSCAKCHERKQ